MAALSLLRAAETRTLLMVGLTLVTVRRVSLHCLGVALLWTELWAVKVGISQSKMTQSFPFFVWAAGKCHWLIARDGTLLTVGPEYLCPKGLSIIWAWLWQELLNIRQRTDLLYWTENRCPYTLRCSAQEQKLMYHPPFSQGDTKGGLKLKLLKFPLWPLLLHEGCWTTAKSVGTLLRISHICVNFASDLSPMNDPRYS